MPRPKHARKPTGTKPVAKPSPTKKPPKPPPGVLGAVENLRAFLEDHVRWLVDEVQSHAELDKMLASLRKLQRDTKYFRSVVPKRSKESFDKFEQWLGEFGYDPKTSAFRIDYVPGDPGDNATLFATRDIDKGDPMIQITSEVIMLPDVNEDSPIGRLIAAVPAIGEMPSVTLALCLLLHAGDPKSKFAPYIGILPASFTIPFGNFTTEEVAALRPSPAAVPALKTLRSQMRNYAYIYIALARLRPPEFPLSVFSVDNFIWAVSVAMTRQNAIPIREPAPLALVPVWDMCNHAKGDNTTQVMLTEEGDVVVENRAMRAFKEGEAITMYYGDRPNVQLLQYSGFVQPDNDFDFVPVYMEIPADVELAAFKVRVVLAKLEVGVKELGRGRGWVVPLHVGGWEGGVERLLGVARVIVADKSGINAILKDGNGLPKESLGDEEQEANAREMVGKVVGSCLKLYDDAEKVCQELSPMARGLILQLHAEEKKVLLKTLAAVTES